ncbi:MAG: caspase family protein, partial [Blastochloris sp.]|nr:caspase family protein [Blastochloris sp.]
GAAGGRGPTPAAPQPPKADAEIERLKLEAEIERLKLEQLKMRQADAPAVAADKPSPPDAGTVKTETGPKVVKPEGGRQVALVIGNGAYQALTRLPTPANDARRMATALTAAGYEVEVGTDLNRTAMAERLAQFYAAARGAQVALFYFSGHGVQVNGRNFLLPVDASFREAGASLDIEARAIELQKFLNAASGARTTVAFVDACRDNPLLDESMAKTLYKGVGATKGLAVIKREELSSGQFVGFAAEEGRTAQTGTGEVSTYTAALLRNLSEKGLDISVLHRRVRRQVEEETHGSQSPRAVDDLREEFVLIP